MSPEITEGVDLRSTSLTADMVNSSEKAVDHKDVGHSSQ